MNAKDPDFLDEVELARQVEGYQRRTESGRVVTVRGYVRTDNGAVADRARNSPGRPAVAAGAGSFPGGRAIPVWPDAGKGVAPTPPEGEDSPDEYEDMPDTGEVDQDALDKEVPVALEIMKNLPQNPALRKLMGILRSFSSASLSDVYTPEDTVELASRRGTVRVKGYSYVNKKGTVVVVNPYTQLRKLMIAMGGPTMAANRGITPDLLDRAFPGMEVKDKLYKVKPKERGVHRFAADTPANRRRAQDALTKINRTVKVDREFDVPRPKPNEDYMAKAMLPTNPLEAVRSAQEGSQVTLGSKAWVRAGDGKWYAAPRRNDKGKTDRQITKEIASRGGSVQLHQAQPIERTAYNSKVDTRAVKTTPADAPAAARYAQALTPVVENLPDGVVDSLSNGLVVKSSTAPKEHAGNMITTRVSGQNKNFPTLNVNPNPEFEKDLTQTIPKQQQQGYMVPTSLHPMETAMARESGKYLESLMQNRAPEGMVDQMYDRLNAVYDRHIKSDSKDNYIGLTGLQGWKARLTGDRSDALKDDIREQLSMSALDSPSDFLAESWTEFVGNPEPRPLARDMGYAVQKSMDDFARYLRDNKWADATDIPQKVWEKTTPKTASRTISDAIGGDTDNTLEYNLAPRELRAVLNHSSKYVDIRDAEGNPLFDAEMVQEGNTAYLGVVSFPQVDAADMPTGVPKGRQAVLIEDTAKYFQTPIDRLNAARENQAGYARFVHQDKSLRALEAVEETLFRQGVTRLETDVAPEDSIIYARAGYGFDPNATDYVEVSNVLKSIQGRLDEMKTDLKAGFFEIPKNVQVSTRRKVNKWLKDINEDPESWPTPQQIADLGKFNIDSSMGEDALKDARFGERSLGEISLRETAWSGVKVLDGKGYDLNIRYPDDQPPSIESTLDEKRFLDAPAPRDVIRKNDPKASVINDVARAINPAEDSPENQKNAALKKAVTRMGNDVLEKHREYLPDAKVSVTGGVGKHKISIKNGDTNLFTVEAQVVGDSLEITQPSFTPTSLASAVFAVEMLDSLETAYQYSGLKTLRRKTDKNDPIGNYVLASMGYDWENPPTRDQLADQLMAQMEKQLAEAEHTIRRTAALNTQDSGTGTQFTMEQRVIQEVGKLRGSLSSQIGAFLQRYDTDPKGPTPFEIAQLGKPEAARMQRIRDMLPPEVLLLDEAPEDPWGLRTPAETAQVMAQAFGGVIPEPEPDVDSGPPVFNPNAPAGVKHYPNIPGHLLPPLPANASAEDIIKYNKVLDKMDKDLERELRKQGTLLQQMTSLDGDATHDTFAEFLGKQALTGGAYGWYKELGGWWDWATDTYKPTARKATVSLLFMLLRLLPSGLTRGALMATTNMLVKKIKSPRPEDWPSPQEIEQVIQELSSHIPEGKLNQIMGGGQ